MKKRLLMIALLTAFLFGTLNAGVPATAEEQGGSTTTNSGSLYGVEMRALLAQMAAYPTPAVTVVPTDNKLLYARAYRRIMKETEVYNAPNGQVISKVDAGFNFVNAGQEKDGFVEIRPGQWMPASVLGPVNKAVSKFSGVTFENGLPAVSFGWVLLDTKPSRTPGARPASGTPEMKRYSLVNIFASVDVDGWLWYLVGPDQWIVQTRLAKVNPAQRPAEIAEGKWVAIDLYEQTAIAYDGDKAIFATLISSGMPKWSTLEGVHKVWDRHALVKMSGAENQPDFYFLPEVPYVMYFNSSEQALHGAYWHDGFGFRRSHGCVNLSITDAQWLFNWTKDTPEAFVFVYHSGEYKHGAPR